MLVGNAVKLTMSQDVEGSKKDPSQTLLVGLPVDPSSCQDTMSTLARQAPSDRAERQQTHRRVAVTGDFYWWYPMRPMRGGQW